MRALLSLLSLMAATVEAASEPVWPLPGNGPFPAEALAEHVQPTAAGTTESALFGCVRNNGRRFHEAIDLGPQLERKRGRATDLVRAVHDGRVVHVNRLAGNSSYGKYLVLEHASLVPAVYTLYSHLAVIAKELVEGDRVRAGQRLGIMGNTAGGYRIPLARAHLHFEVGLRLSDNFQDWYDRQRFGSENPHGNYNGMNLVGLDPLLYFGAYHRNEAEQPLHVLERFPAAAIVHVAVSRRPDFLRRYPSLELDGCAESTRAGWAIHFTAWGLPVAFRGLTGEQLRGVRGRGEISVVAVDANEAGKYACRDLVERTDEGRWRLGDGGRQVMELLFLP
ncbi:MAG: peptidoglycan DD-metalloendopeptidase family protein [Verrucomicrobia bacterium]|jgi:hypothetical protein|nr:peptidoglycan DD-metalloendopeptidase family protein [Verrucomicrobiota bacterium]